MWGLLGIATAYLISGGGNAGRSMKGAVHSGASFVRRNVLEVVAGGVVVLIVIQVFLGVGN